MSDLPTVDEAFGPPTADEAFPPPKVVLGEKELSAYFSEEKRRVVGERPYGLNQEQLDFARSTGFFGGLEKGQRTLMQQLNESLFSGGTAAVDYIFRQGMGIIYGMSATAVAQGHPRDLTPAALLEAYPAGRLTGLPTRIRPATSHHIDLDAAEQLGVLDKTPENAFAPLEVVPEVPVAATPGTFLRTAEPGETFLRTAETPAAEIHDLARQVAPETFAKYDDLLEQKIILEQWARELKDAAPELYNLGEVSVPATATLGELEQLGRARLGEAGADTATHLIRERAVRDINRIEKDVAALDRQLQEMAPEITESYREARRILPDDPAMRYVEPSVEPPAGTTRFYHGGVPLEETLGGSRWLTQDRAYAEGYAAKSEGGQVLYVDIPNDSPLLVKQFDDTGTSQVSPFVHFDAPPEIARELKPAAPEIQTLSQRNLGLADSIRRDTEQQLVAAGRPVEEARAAAALVQAHYEARAARFGGALGTARELYETEAPTILAAAGNQRGQLNILDNTLRLFKNADASTFVHETAHGWLFELLRDNEHPAAPSGLKADVTTVKEWLGAEGTLTRAQHEKFARGFERYMMEGQAPSSRLVKVFEQFRNWLVQIYQSVARLRAPITEDVRGVYDRLLSKPNSDPVIAPERPGARTFSEDHLASVQETPAAEAATRAAEVRAQRDQVAAGNLNEELENGRREARRGPERVSIPRDVKPGGGDGSGGASDGAPATQLGEGRSPVMGKSETPPGAADRFTDVGGALVDENGKVRLENVLDADDVRKAVYDAAALNGGDLGVKRAVLTDVETLQLADSLGTSPRMLDRRQIGEAFNAEQVLAVKEMLRESDTAVRNAAVKAATGGEAEIIAYALARERHIMIAEQFLEVRAEAGRALRAFRQLEGLKDVVELDVFFQKTMNKTAEELRQEAKMLAKADSPKKIAEALARLRNPTWKDMFAEGLINWFVSGPFTHMVNIGSNATVAAYSVAETAGAATVGVLTGRRAVQYAEVGDRVVAMGQGAIDGVKAAGKILWDENNISSSGRTVDTRVMQAIPSVRVTIGGMPIKLGGATIRIPGRLLAAEDSFFNSVAFNQELHVLARRAAREEGLVGQVAEERIAEHLLHPSGSMVAAARQYAEYQTFTNRLGPYGQALQNFANTHPLARYFLPFVRTPINLFKYSAERTPIGFAFKEVRDNITGKNGPIARDTQIARMAMGNMVGVGIGALVFQQRISGGGPKDAGAQETDRNIGKQPYSMRVGELWYSYRRFDPLANVIGLAADMAEVAQYVKTNDDEYEKLGSMVALSLWRNFGDKLSLRGIGSIFQAVHDYDRHGQTFLNGIAGSIVPAVSGQLARIADPYMREARTMLDAIKSRVPAIRQELFTKRDRWGEPIFDTELGPVQVRAINRDPVNIAMKELGLNTAQPHRKLGNGVELTGQQYDDYVRVSGRAAKELLNPLVTPEFRTLPKGIQIKMISKMIDVSRKIGRGYIMKENLGGEDDIVRKGIELRMKQLQ